MGANESRISRFECCDKMPEVALSGLVKTIEFHYGNCTVDTVYTFEDNISHRHHVVTLNKNGQTIRLLLNWQFNKNGIASVSVVI